MRGTRLAFLLFALSAGAPAAPPGADELLSSTLPERREEGAALLGQQGDTAAAKRLIALLDDPDWGVQMAAIRALAPIKFEAGRDAIREKAFEGKIRGIRTLAARCLKEHDADHQAARIASNLTRFKAEARLPLLEALGILGTPEAIEALSEQMRAPEPEHRIGAARALGRLHGGEKGLVRGLKDKEPAVVILAAIALAGVDTDSARAEVLDHVAKLDPVEGYVFRRVGRRGGEVNREAFAKGERARGQPPDAHPVRELRDDGGVDGGARQGHALDEHFYLQKEGFAKASSEEERKVFAADHLGLTPQEIRELDAKGAFKDINNTTPISRTYSMFHLLANFINEKQRRDLQR